MKNFSSVVVFVENLIRFKKNIWFCVEERVVLTEKNEWQIVEIESVDLSFDASLASWITRCKELIYLRGEVGIDVE